MGASHYPGGNPPDAESWRTTFRELADALAERRFRCLFMGGVGAATLSRPRLTDDIDVLVHPEDVADLLDHLAERGFTTRLVDPTWLAKAHRHGVLVDVIFRSTGDIYLDATMLDHAREEEHKGRLVRVVGPEDLLVIKAVAAAEHSPHHWFDALGLVARGDLDWEYLVTRARRFGPRRVLALLLYAESSDLTVDEGAVRALYESVHAPSRGHDARLATGPVAR